MRVGMFFFLMAYGEQTQTIAFPQGGSPGQSRPLDLFPRCTVLFPYPMRGAHRESW
jgi:hypothetical protein